MLYYSASNINHRYLGSTYVDPSSPAAKTAALIRDRHFLLAHRHRLSLIGDSPEECPATPANQPCPEWVPRLSGDLFSSAQGYDGPGVHQGNNVYSIGSYGSWRWRKDRPEDMNRN